ncbi:hypothetical protein NC652_036105 [Populus alba x Populus x berolinensis]|nr:hypothetical protein NC652_036105 [Populus alba x Populus x berolinensis]
MNRDGSLSRKISWRNLIEVSEWLSEVWLGSVW